MKTKKELAVEVEALCLTLQREREEHLALLEELNTRKSEPGSVRIPYNDRTYDEYIQHLCDKIEEVEDQRDEARDMYEEVREKSVRLAHTLRLQTDAMYQLTRGEM